MILYCTYLGAKPTGSQAISKVFQFYFYIFDQSYDFFYIGVLPLVNKVYFPVNNRENRDKEWRKEKERKKERVVDKERDSKM